MAPEVEARVGLDDVKIFKQILEYCLSSKTTL